VGSLTTLVPERRAEVLSLGWWSLLADNVATGLSGAVVGLF
jgi:nucleoside permease NupC